MKISLWAILLFCNSVLADSGLPKRSIMKKLILPNLKTGNEIALNLDVILPDDHKLNKGAPSAVDVYEMVGKAWKKKKTLNLREYFSLGNKISLFEKLQLETSDGLVAIDSTVFHCDFKNSHCVIESFQGIANRNSNGSSTTLTTTLTATRP